ncbi:MAG: ion channel, partial [Candidatus Thiodiazotropha sp.]
RESLYFSMVSFTTLGYGDISPDIVMLDELCSQNTFKSYWGCSLPLIVSLEGLLGASMIALLMATIIRRSISDH